MSNIYLRLKEFKTLTEKLSFRRLQKAIGLLLAFILGFSLYKVAVELTVEEITIFGFHDIVNLDKPSDRPPQRPFLDGDYTKQDLQLVVESLVEQNYWFLTTQELYDYFVRPDRLPIPPEHRGQKRVMFSTDDGYTSAHFSLMAIAESIEKKYGKKIKIVWFVNPPFMGKTGLELPHATCQELRDGFQKGYYDLQSHGSNHTDFRTLNDRDLENDLSKAQQLLRDCVGDLDPDRTVARHVAYPFGDADDRVEKIVSKYYLSGYVYNNQMLKLDRLKNPYHIPRVGIHNRIPPKKLLWLAKGGLL
jgi:poly-beta-1,6-N-acetyl-D-glucosamine N-deacetylase